MMQRIAVIGAGAAGLCAARHIVSRSNLSVVVYEQTKLVGGTWNYTEETEVDVNGLKIHSSMYKNLRTNLPKETMEFPDFPFDEKFPSFMKHEDVQSYLESYCDHFSLRKYIEFETIVELVKPIDTDSGKKWEVRIQKLKERSLSTTLFDAVFVCNGHYAEPHIPDVPGREHFKGQLIHSHLYRHPEVFSGQTVVIFGAHASGQDISLDVAKYAKRVVISHRTPRIISELPQNVSQVETVAKFEKDGRTIVFTDGNQVEADSFIFCTGYHYSFPFLHDTCEIEVEKGRVKYLYNHTLSAAHPSLIFIGICSKICPFPQFHFQVLYGMGVLDGSIELPSKEEMMKEIERDYQERLESGLPHRASHVMSGARQWDYNDSLADAAKVPRLHKRVMDLYFAVAKSRTEMVCQYKNHRILTEDDGSYRVDVSGS